MKLALAILCLFTMTNMWAQAPTVMSVTPTAQKVNAAADAAITVTFDTEINPTSITNISFRVMGRWSGPAQGTTVLENDNKTIRFTPDEPFFAGEALGDDNQATVHGACQTGYAQVEKLLKS